MSKPLRVFAIDSSGTESEITENMYFFEEQYVDALDEKGEGGFTEKYRFKILVNDVQVWPPC